MHVNGTRYDCLEDKECGSKTAFEGDSSGGFEVDIQWSISCVDKADCYLQEARTNVTVNVVSFGGRTDYIVD